MEVNANVNVWSTKQENTKNKFISQVVTCFLPDFGVAAGSAAFSVLAPGVFFAEPENSHTYMLHKTLFEIQESNSTILS